MRPLARRPDERAAEPFPQVGDLARALLLALCLCGMQSPCRGQDSGILCSGGSGKFVSKLDYNETVSVESQKEKGFATHACEADLTWKNTKTPAVRDAWQVDIDVLGADLGLGVPVVAFQIKKSDVDSQMSYEVYSLRGPPRLLRTITGGDFFRAADTNLEGRIELWTHDAGVAGFEGLPLADFDFAPAVVMRFEGQRLIDVGKEFQPYYDRQIAELRATLDPRQLSDFRKSDGTLDAIPPWQSDKIHGLETAKIRVLEIVWAYLYSGREQDAWHALGEMWPAADFDRIRASIAAVRARGICSQVDGVSSGVPPKHKMNHAPVYDLTVSTKSDEQGYSHLSGSPDTSGSPAEPPPVRDFVMPQSIIISTPFPQNAQQSFPHQGVPVELVVDAAGKIFSAKLLDESDKSQIVDALIAASSQWKFIPALKNGKAVASRIRMTVSPLQ